MNREIALFLRDRLFTLPWVDKALGMVKTIERVRTDESGKTLTQRFPASLDAVQPLKQGEYVDAIPDGVSYKNLFYVEDMSTRVLQANQYESEVRLVGWMNHHYKTGGDSLAIAHILKAIPLRANAGNLHSMLIKPGRILGVEDRIFSRYTYSEHLKQFLMAPYSAFAIDFTVNYSVNTSCLPDYNEEDPEPPTPITSFVATALSSKEILLNWV